MCLQDPERGRNLTLRVASDIHVNVSAAMLRALDEAIMAVRDIVLSLWRQVVEFITLKTRTLSLSNIFGHVYVI